MSLDAFQLSSCGYHWIHVHVAGHESHGTYSQYQCATKLPISRVTCHLPNQTSIGNSIGPVDVVFFQMHVELKHSSKVFQFLLRVQYVCGQQPLFGSTIWDRAHQAALPTSHKTLQDKGDDDEGDGDDDDEGDVDCRW